MQVQLRGAVVLVVAAWMAGCSKEPQNPAAPESTGGRQSVTAVDVASEPTSGGPATPPFNLEAVLRSPDGGAGFGLVKFRQPKDDQKIIYLDVWVRDLAPNTAYSLQRAADSTIDGQCTGAAWLTLGKGLTPQDIFTDDMGTDREELFRDVSAAATGTQSDIHFRIIDKATQAVALESGCYNFIVSE